MLIDINTYVGHWPFRALPRTSAGALVQQMDKVGIDLAVVGSLHGLFYKNAQAANEELAEEVEPYRDRLIPFATLNPGYPGWEEDLRRCAEELGMRGLRLYPQYHGYQLTEEEPLALIDAAAQLGWVVQVPMQVVDRRQRHRWDLAEDLKAEDLVAAVVARPTTRWMFLSVLGLEGVQFPQEGRFLVDISRMDAVLRRSIQGLIEELGAEHLAFGTGMLLKMPEPALLKLGLLDAPEETRERIAWGHTAQIMGLEVGSR